MRFDSGRVIVVRARHSVCAVQHTVATMFLESGDPFADQAVEMIRVDGLGKVMVGSPED